MIMKKHYFLMISCPSDVIRERELIKECVEVVNNERSDNSWIELNYWVTDTISDAGTPAQESINKQLVEDSDGLIAIFNARLGTPVHEYPCGTAEEIALMLSAKKHVSLLFNTAPRIDLTKEDSIEQIKKLQGYKEEKKSCSYYREFNDDESFKSLVLQEIRLWLRSITVGTKQIVVIDGGHVYNDNQEMDTISTKEDKSTNLGSEEQPEPGILDCVLYITNANIELKCLADKYTELLSIFQIKTDEFIQKFTYSNKQNNTSGSIILCKGYAKDIDEWRVELEDNTNNLEVKWNSICSYIKIIPKDIITKDDKIIMKTTLGTLRNQFSDTMQKTKQLLAIIDKIPNIQKDLNSAMKNVKSSFAKYYKFLETAVINCEDLENLFM